MKAPAIVFALLVAPLVAGCVRTTPYQREGAFNWKPGGYRDSEISPGRYEVKFTGNARDEPGKLLAMWHRRARELCESDSYAADVAEKREIQTTIIPAGTIFVPVTSEIAVVTGTVTCDR
ncbi:MAG: hypothetical protein IT495_14080 [Gammaproteobacteria bacterium]|nr:hypothetical protein [Gammaproteobacteria bacterium]